MNNSDIYTYFTYCGCGREEITLILENKKVYIKYHKYWMGQDKIDKNMTGKFIIDEKYYKLIYTTEGYFFDLIILPEKCSTEFDKDYDPIVYGNGGKSNSQFSAILSVNNIAKIFNQEERLENNEPFKLFNSVKLSIK